MQKPDTVPKKYIPQLDFFLNYSALVLSLSIKENLSRTKEQATLISTPKFTRAPFPDNDGSTFVRSFLRWIFQCIVKFFRVFPETPLNMNARALFLRRRRFVTVH